MAEAFPDVRRPTQYEQHLQVLTQEVFETMRDSLVFCAALGFSENRREGFAAMPNPISWSTMAGNQFFEQVLFMITAATSGESPEALGDDGIRERVRSFEEFACGGLSIIANEMARGVSGEDVILSLITRKLSLLDDERSPFSPFASQ